MSRTIRHSIAATVGLLCGLVLISQITGALQETALPRLLNGSVGSAIAEGSADGTESKRSLQIAQATITTGGGVLDGGGPALVGQSITGTCEGPNYRLAAGGIYGLLPPVFGDFDRNRRVNLQDHRRFALCLSGPDVVADPDCAPGDADRVTDDLPLAGEEERQGAARECAPLNLR